jgi:ubiquinone biosynthesis protein
MLRSLRNTRRLFAITMILAREDALFIFDALRVAPLFTLLGKLVGRKHPEKTKAQRLVRAIERLGPSYIKLGQALSTRSDLIGEELADGLGSLRDKLPPFPSAVAKQIVQEAFGKPVSELFAEFEDEPVAAASIAQVHRAVLHDGRTVAVKILRPGIEEAFARDVELFMWIAETVQKRVEGMRRLKPVEVVSTFKETVFFELDLRFEAAAASEMADNVKRHEPGLRIPAMYWDYTSRHVMCSEWVDGIPFSDMDAIRASGFDLNMMLSKASRSLFSQVFKDGYFHADLHPGNLFLDAKGDLVAVDFGIMGRLDWSSRVYIAEIIGGFLREDYKRVADMHFDAGYVPATKSREAFTQACMAVARPIMGKPLSEISVAQLLGQMFAIAAEFEMEVQPQLLLMQKTLMVAEGVGRMLNPNLNMWELASPLIEDWARESFGLRAQVKKKREAASRLLHRLPRMVEQAEHAFALLGNAQGMKLHPDSIRAIAASSAATRAQAQRPWLVLGWVALGVISALISADWLF